MSSQKAFSYYAKYRTRWSAIVDDKHRGEELWRRIIPEILLSIIPNALTDAAENYLGSTVNAPQGRWQKNKDIHWYTRDVDDSDAAEAARRKKEELRRIKEAEEDALSAALGFAPSKKFSGDGDAPGTGANGIAVGKSQKDEEVDMQEKEERKKDKERV